NDYLNGGPGNDTLTGGPGADRYVCGPGRDTVVGDSKDVAAKDCEVVTGLKTTPPPSPPPAPEPTTTTTSTTPAPTPSVNVLQGRYCGFTNQGQSICFTVDPSGRSFSSAHFGATPACRPPEPSWIFTLDFPSHVTINADGSFVYDVNVGDLTGSFVHGSIDGAGSASGTMHMTPQSFDKAGYGHYDCDSVDTTWQAKLQQ
ncbi:MAG: hypothetical protein ACXVYM_07230, partial [Gaiellaceae bacterium]